ncbi:MAG: periplasmic heavy metal sensor [Betaproteobacteria bacterium]|nr:periplasmic heavy metal sensor [Betaproteobacteria bacterium]
MTDSYKAPKSRALLLRRTLFSGALALTIAGPLAVLPGAARAAGEPRPGWHEQHERLRDDLIRDALRLSPQQQQAWQAIRARQEAQRAARRQTWSEVRQALQAELAKPEPDLARVAALRDRASERNLQARKEIEDMRLKLYATFSPEQKAVVKDFLKARLARAEHWRMHRHGPRGARAGEGIAPRGAS